MINTLSRLQTKLDTFSNPDSLTPPNYIPQNGEVVPLTSAGALLLGKAHIESSNPAMVKTTRTHTLELSPEFNPISSSNQGNRSVTPHALGFSPVPKEALAPHLLIQKFPNKWVKPKLLEYKGSTNPEDHVHHFVTNVEDLMDHQDL